MSIERPGESKPEISPFPLVKITRSPILDQFRLSPFRVLQLPIDASAEEAVWKADDVMALISAGLPAADGDCLPWLPEPGEIEVRQAVQWIEEPLRRLVEECFWFDFADDPDGESLRRGLMEMDPQILAAYLNRDGLEAGMASKRNEANLRLLLAALAMSDALPDGMTGGRFLETDPKPLWKNAAGLRVAEGEVLLFGRSRRAIRLNDCRDYWSGAIDRWSRLLNDPTFIEYLRASILRLNDELVGEDDVEVLVSGARSRLMDLVVAELKRQVLEGRSDRVRVVLGVLGKSSIESNQWSQELRPLRHLFRAELVELNILLENPDSLDLDDVAIYLARLDSLVRRWKELDASELLGLTEIADEAVRNIDGLISHREDFGSIERVQELLKEAETIATAASVKQKIESHSKQIASRTRWACHFCHEREMQPEFSTVLRAQKEAGRTYGYNSTTIHYDLRYELVQRCERCADLHQYYAAMGIASRFALVIPLIATYYWIYHTYFVNRGVTEGFLVLFSLQAVALLFVVGLSLKYALAWRLTPKEEKKFWDLKTSRQHKMLADESYSIKRDYRKNAFEIAKTHVESTR